ncbi:MAG: ATP-binding protein [Subdoligranulum variabile]|uniref:ATP-binding protein n=1 Tax=Gemmiger sp. TaxID=2049027 RepID=UPI002A80F100|nr:ATP-binding protein [Gemmiger sp.]MCI7641928.1 ATP-binding protein [Subdoligranulum variabile]MDD6425560.1 ATP-binding protein [Subdoligranulum variabile]MDY4773757.1 ATP-binding protein [Gemmiger sp.]MDY5202989.1 ATP-binding protein [Gemmiger sp.]MDY5502541.1 ATP-binding protein [Gemmiger sp.]
MTAVPDIPRLYTALAECLATLLYAQQLTPRYSARRSTVNSLIWMAGLAVFMQLTGSVPLVLWLPCMVAAIGSMYLFLWRTCETSPLEAGYYCSRAFILAELTASVEWQLHCALWPQRSGRDLLAVLLLVIVYAALFTAVYWMEKRRSTQPARLHITPLGMLTAVIMAITVFAVSNLSFVNNSEATMSIRYIRTLVDLAGVLILTVQHEQLRESALHSELSAMDDVLRRQYEQYRQSKENIKLINRRYHELKVQIATIRAERDQAKQDAALAAMESDIRRYEAENKTGNPVLDTLLTAKSLYCQQHGINMTCVADGKLLDFLSTGEICTIVGTALDNATESVAAEPDPEKKLIRVAIYAQNGFVMLRFENYCAQPVELGPDGLPLRSAHGGYDLKSVRAAAEAYGGTLTLHWEDEWFTLRVLLPQR